MKIPPAHVLLIYYYYTCAFIHNGAHKVAPENGWYVVRTTRIRSAFGPTKCN